MERKTTTTLSRRKALSAAGLGLAAMSSLGRLDASEWTPVERANVQTVNAAHAGGEDETPPSAVGASPSRRGFPCLPSPPAPPPPARGRRWPDGRGTHIEVGDSIQRGDADGAVPDFGQEHIPPSPCTSRALADVAGLAAHASPPVPSHHCAR